MHPPLCLAFSCSSCGRLFPQLYLVGARATSIEHGAACFEAGWPGRHARIFVDRNGMRTADFKVQVGASEAVHAQEGVHRAPRDGRPCRRGC